MTAPEYAYLAGILDGEGYVAFFKVGKNKGRDRPQMEVSSVDEELIRWLHDTVGGWRPASRPARENRKEEHRWRCSGREAAELAKYVSPYMQIHRKRSMVESFIGW